MPLPRLSIRAKLLLAAASLLVVPWLGYRYVQDLEAYLRQNQEQALLERAAVIAALVSHEESLAQWRHAAGALPADVSHIYVRPLSSPMQLDGYRDDWQNDVEREQPLGHMPDTDASFGATYMLGTHGNYLYLFVSVRDDRVVYRSPQSLRLDRNDHLRLGLLDPDGVYRRYWLATIAPGWVNAFRMPADAHRNLPGEPEFAIKGEWQQTTQGYDVELRIPITLVGSRFAVAVADVDEPGGGEPRALLGTGDTETPGGLSTLALPVSALDRLLATVQRPLTRTWVVDPGGRVIALAGDVRVASEDEERASDSTSLSFSRGVLRALYRLILQPPPATFEDVLSTASRLEHPAISAALAGQPSALWRPTSDAQVSILTAAYPLTRYGESLGAVAIEQTSTSIQILQNRAIEALVNLTMLAFLVVTLVLLFFATRLSLRVRRLRNEVELAIGGDGRIRGDISQQRAGDEVGDLSRSFAAMLKRLREYNRYLESMASKLSHELRTPISVVRSSLDNLDSAQLSADAQVYATRAREGVERLSNLLARMSEATRLEQSIQHEARVPFDLTALVRACADGYRSAHPQRDIRFVVATNDDALVVEGSAELMAQLLDKLVENALDFALDATPVDIELAATPATVTLAVSNQGSPLPAEMQGSLFDSMVSMRETRTASPHLGLGLYVARLIADYHQARIEAHNRSDVSGARFVLSIPRAPRLD